MNVDEAARILRKKYDETPNRDRMLTVHLFGIEFGPAIESSGITAAELSRKAFPDKTTLGPQIAAGIKLSHYVMLRKEK